MNRVSQQISYTAGTIVPTIAKNDDCEQQYFETVSFPQIKLLFMLFFNKKLLFTWNNWVINVVYFINFVESIDYGMCVNMKGLNFCELYLYNVMLFAHLCISNILPHPQTEGWHVICVWWILAFFFWRHLINMLYSQKASSLFHVTDILMSDIHVGPESRFNILMPKMMDT